MGGMIENKIIQELKKIIKTDFKFEQQMHSFWYNLFITKNDWKIILFNFKQEYIIEDDNVIEPNVIEKIKELIN